MLIVDIVKSLNKMLGLFNPQLVPHLAQVTYLSKKIGEHLGLSPQAMQDLVIASSIHDIGLLSLSQKESYLLLEESFPATHSLTVFLLFNNIPFFHQPSKIVKYHHANYDRRGIHSFQNNFDDGSIPLESYIVRLADRLAVHINPLQPILEQVEDVYRYIEVSKDLYHPEVLDVFNSVIKKQDYLWLELVTIPPDLMLEKILLESMSRVPEKNIFSEIAEIIGYLIDFKSQFTASHSYCVAEISSWLFHSGKFPVEEPCDIIREAGFLHDIGKLAIPIEILEKPGQLNSKEWNIMRAHVYYSHIALETMYKEYPCLRYTPYHHEKLDGSGYPFGLKGEDIPVIARIIAVSDVFTAITENRPYRGELTESEVVKIMKPMAVSKKLDEDIVNYVLAHFKEAKERRDEAESLARHVYNGFREDIRKYYENELKSKRISV
ncbi:MAG: HD-GYP domain-containing protein [Candidatus Hydrogenedens sp.]